MRQFIRDCREFCRHPGFAPSALRPIHTGRPVLISQVPALGSLLSALCPPPIFCSSLLGPQPPGCTFQVYVVAWLLYACSSAYSDLSEAISMEKRYFTSDLSSRS